MLRGRQSKPELSGVMTDDLETCNRNSVSDRSERNPEVSERNCCCVERRTWEEVDAGECICLSLAHLFVYQTQGVFNVGIL